MFRLFQYNSKFSRIISSIADLAILSILWFLLSLTVVGFGPACTALYYAVVKSIRRHRSSALKEFFRALKVNFGKGFVFGILVIGFALFLFFFAFPETTLSPENPNVAGILPLLIGIFLLLSFSVYLFPLQSRFDTTIVHILLHTIIFIFRHFSSTVLMVIMLMTAMGFVLFYPPFILFIPGLFVLSMSFSMERILQKHTAEESIPEDPQKDQWYLE